MEAAVEKLRLLAAINSTTEYDRKVVRFRVMFRFVPCFVGFFAYVRVCMCVLELVFFLQTPTRNFGKTLKKERIEQGKVFPLQREPKGRGSVV